MKTTLYIHSEALKCASNESESNYKNKFCGFVKDLVFIHNMKMDDHFCVSKNLCMEPLCNGRDIFSIADETLCGDEIDILYRVLANTAQECDLPLSQLKELCLYHAEEAECCTLAVLNSDKDMEKKDNPYITFDCYEIVYGKKDWITFRRQVLGNHPETPNRFIESCKLLFPQLFFHSNCTESVSGYLDKIPRKIVYYLSCLNDRFVLFRETFSSTQANDILEGFAGKYGLDKEGSIERNAQHKKSFTYMFPVSNNLLGVAEKKVICEPHLKISKYDENYVKQRGDDEAHFNARIYFSFGDEDVVPGKILVGSIGPHI